MTFDPNGLYYQMIRFFSENKDKDDKVIICNEGSSRSSKTWDAIHFIVTYCDHNRDGNKDIYFLRDTLVNCRDFTLKEVDKCFKKIGIPFNPTLYPKPYFNLWGNNLYFRGLDDESSMEGFPSHISFVNEMLDVSTFNMISGILMRCEEIFLADWNPKFSDHWAYQLEKRPNCLFTHSTYKNNKHLPISIVREIEGYDPSRQENIDKNTADDYRWNVYGLGLRASPQGLVFRDVEWIETFPDNIERIAVGLDFGYTNSPTAIVKVGKNGRNLYLQLLFYKPVDNAADLAEVITALNIGDTHLWADSADPGMIGDLRAKGIRCLAVGKFPGSIRYGIDLMKQHKIHVVRNPDIKREFENYKWREIQGIMLNEPIDDFNHAIDAARYACIMEFRR